MIRKLFNWIFKAELETLKRNISNAEKLTEELLIKKEKIDNLLGNIDISVDHHLYAPSWAVISIQGKESDYIKFIELGEKDIRDLQLFLQRYDRKKVDSLPRFSKMIKFDF